MAMVNIKMVGMENATVFTVPNREPKFTVVRGASVIKDSMEFKIGSLIDSGSRCTSAVKSSQSAVSTSGRAER